MPTRKFLPYEVLGAGIWAATFCVLGFVFWRSFDRLTQWVSRGLFALGLLAAVVAGITFLVRLQRKTGVAIIQRTPVLDVVRVAVDETMVTWDGRHWHRRPTAMAALSRILSEPDPPTAVFSSNARCTVSVVSIGVGT